MVKSLAYTVDRNMVVDEFGHLFAWLKSSPYEIFLDSVEPMQIPRVQDNVLNIRKLEM